jgi:hypothetical protein
MWGPKTKKKRKENMALKQRKQTACPEGVQLGRISAARETKKDFGKGPEPVVEIVIQPDYAVEGAETVPVSVIFSPTLNGLSALSQFLQRLGKEPPEGADFNVATLGGTRVRFEAKRQDNGFMRVLKESITAA